MKAREQILNAVPSILWTGVFIGPVYFFCAHYLSTERICWFAVAGALFMLLPKVSMERLAFSSNPAAYRQMQVPLLIKITQDAGWLRRLGGSSEKRVRRDRRALAQIVRDTWVRERFHLGLCLFCILCSAVALLNKQPRWFLALTLINLFYNLYPIWLQQYLRLRVTRYQVRARLP